VIPSWYVGVGIRTSGPVAPFFGTCTNLFPSGKAKIAVETRQVFISRTVRL